jgi:hypothetical protein
MPVHAVTKNGKVVGFQYGETGKVYSVKAFGGKAGAAKKAGQQGSAIEHNSGKK